MKTMLGMITAPAAILSTMAFMAMATPAAQAGEFCMTNSSGMRGCGYATMEQCQASASGINGSCNRDPFYDTANNSSPRNALAYSPKHARAAKHPVAN